MNPIASTILLVSLTALPVVSMAAHVQPVVCIALPKAQLGQGNNSPVDVSEPVRTMLGQYMAGPSPLLPGSQPQPTRFVAGWKVNSGRLNRSQTTYITVKVRPNTRAKALNLADAASDDVAAFVVGVAVVVVFMIHTPERC